MLLVFWTKKNLNGLFHVWYKNNITKYKVITFDCKTQTNYNEDVRKEKKEEKKLLHINININAWRNHGGLQNIRVQRGQREQSGCTQSKLIVPVVPNWWVE